MIERQRRKERVRKKKERGRSEHDRDGAIEKKRRARTSHHGAQQNGLLILKGRFRAFNREYLGPLSEVPGPKKAA